MEQSWDSGDFWVTYAARKNFAFDSIYWLNINERFFGPGMRWKQRMDLLDDEQKANLEKLVSRKLQEKETRVLAWEPDEVDGDARLAIEETGPCLFSPN